MEKLVDPISPSPTTALILNFIKRAPSRSRFLYKNTNFYLSIFSIILILISLPLLASSSQKAGSSSKNLHSPKNPTNESSLIRNLSTNETLLFSNKTDENCGSSGGGKCMRPMGIDMKKLSLELIRQDILRKLRLDEKRLPNVTALPREYLNTLTNIVDMQNDSPHPTGQFDDDHATTEKIIAFSRTQQVKNNGKGINAFYFTFSEKLSTMGIDSASIHILLKFHGNSLQHHKGDLYIRVMQLVSERKGESPVFNNYGPIKAVVRPSPTGAHFRHDSSKWIEIDVRHVFSKWLANTPSSRKMGLSFDVTDATQGIIPHISVVMGSEPAFTHQNPFFEIEVSESGRSRPPRDLGLDCVESQKETRCCRYPLTVDFDEFGWDWVIAPKQYDANYCSGECPFAFLQTYPHNHIVQQASRGMGGPCCTARKLSPITMLHFDQDSNIAFSVLPGMLVDQCACS